MGIIINGTSKAVNRSGSAIAAVTFGDGAASSAWGSNTVASGSFFEISNLSNWGSFWYFTVQSWSGNTWYGRHSQIRRNFSTLSVNNLAGTTTVSVTISSSTLLRVTNNTGVTLTFNYSFLRMI